MLTRTISSIFAFFALVALISPFQMAMAQRSHLAYQHKYDSGQTIQPIFQGWSKNEDGTFDMHFGYL
ncbi:MAG: hypothetical protein HN872_04870, partial [Gammaproteobacteria bacterium]|nr:hypothetical protein [Gammaproteobacteria bacterium]